jgi:hypothetical protein
VDGVVRGDRDDFWGRYESLVDEQIRKATEDGAFDDLPGAGRPLGLPARDDENWWVREKMRAEGVPLDALLPMSLQLRKAVAALPDTVRDLPDEAAVRAVVHDLNQRIVRWLRMPSGPQVPLRRVSADAVVERWAAERAAARARAAELLPGAEPRSGSAGDGRPPWWRRVWSRSR